MRTFRNTMLAAFGLSAILVVPASAAYYTVNGAPPPALWAQYMAAKGLPSGHYWLNQQGYWGVMGNTTPLGNIYAGTYSYRNGSGEQGARDWSVRSGGFSVGGESNGCIYAGSWSNC